MKVPSYLGNITKWLLARGYRLEILPRAKAHCDYGTRVVTLPKEPRRARMMALALHECGHVLVLERRGASAWQSPAARNRRGTDRWYVAVLDEELEAWRLGMDLASELGIDIDEKQLERVKNEGIMSYVRYAAERGSPRRLLES